MESSSCLYVIVPHGWQRIVEGSRIVYVSPDNRRLRTRDELLRHLTSAGTCKCGLKCPFKFDEQFNFDANVLSLPDSRPFTPAAHCKIPPNLLFVKPKKTAAKKNPFRAPTSLPSQCRAKPVQLVSDVLPSVSAGSIINNPGGSFVAVTAGSGEKMGFVRVINDASSVPRLTQGGAAKGEPVIELRSLISQLNMVTRGNQSSNQVAATLPLNWLTALQLQTPEGASSPLPSTYNLSTCTSSQASPTKPVYSRSQCHTASQPQPIGNVSEVTRVASTAHEHQDSASLGDQMTTHAKTSLLSTGTGTSTETNLLSTSTGTSLQSTSTETNLLSTSTGTSLLSTNTETNLLSTSTGTSLLSTSTETNLLSTCTGTSLKSTGTSLQSTSTGTSLQFTSPGSPKSAHIGSPSPSVEPLAEAKRDLPIEEDEKKDEEAGNTSESTLSCSAISDVESAHISKMKDLEKEGDNEIASDMQATFKQSFSLQDEEQALKPPVSTQQQRNSGKTIPTLDSASVSPVSSLAQSASEIPCSLHNSPAPSERPVPSHLDSSASSTPLASPSDNLPASLGSYVDNSFKKRKASTSSIASGTSSLTTSSISLEDPVQASTDPPRLKKRRKRKALYSKTRRHTRPKKPKTEQDEIQVELAGKSYSPVALPKQTIRPLSVDSCDKIAVSSSPAIQSDSTPGGSYQEEGGKKESLTAMPVPIIASDTAVPSLSDSVQPNTVLPAPSSPTQPNTVLPASSSAQPSTVEPAPSSPVQLSTAVPASSPTQPSTVVPPSSPVQPSTAEPAPSTQPITAVPASSPTQPSTFEPSSSSPVQPSTVEPAPSSPVQPSTVEPASSSTQPSTAVSASSPTQPSTVEPAPSSPVQPSAVEPAPSSPVQPNTVEPASSPVQPSTVEPARSSPVQPNTAVPASSPTPTQPSTFEPSSSPVQPSAVEPAPSSPLQPSTVEPDSSPVQPSTVEPASSPVQPSTVEPAPSSPVQPSTVEPAPSSPVQPSTVEPASSPVQPSTVEPAPSSPLQPSTVEPAPSSPVQPSTVEPDSSPVQPSTVEPARSSPVQPSTVEPAPSSPVQPSTVEPAPSSPVQSSTVEPASFSPVQPSTVEAAPSSPVQPSTAVPASSSSSTLTIVPVSSDTFTAVPVSLPSSEQPSTLPVSCSPVQSSTLRSSVQSSTPTISSSPVTSDALTAVPSLSSLAQSTIFSTSVSDQPSISSDVKSTVLPASSLVASNTMPILPTSVQSIVSSTQKSSTKTSEHCSAVTDQLVTSPFKEEVKNEEEDEMERPQKKPRMSEDLGCVSTRKAPPHNLFLPLHVGGGKGILPSPCSSETGSSIAASSYDPLTSPELQQLAAGVEKGKKKRKRRGRPPAVVKKQISETQEEPDYVSTNPDSLVVSIARRMLPYKIHYHVLECYPTPVFEVGDVIWAKASNLPAWPAQIISHTDWTLDTLDPAPQGQVWVCWFGQKSVSLVEVENLKLLKFGYLGAKNRIRKLYKKKIEEAMREAMQAWRKREEEKASLKAGDSAVAETSGGVQLPEKAVDFPSVESDKTISPT